MGNSQSNNKSKDDIISFLLKIDSFAAKYLFDPKITHSTKMGDVDYCDNLVIMTSDIISKNLSTLSIEYLAQRTENGIEIDKMDKEKVIYLNKSELSNLDEKNKTKKRRLCIGIAKFYVKVAQLYSAILKTINPVYVYTNSNNEKITLSYKDKKKIPEGFSFSSTQINLCNNKINTLLNGEEFSEKKKQENKEVTIQPNICKVNLVGDKDKKFMEEEGLPEFEKLFYDVYNYDLGIFDKMSDSMKESYNSALKSFYKAYTGSKDGEMPSEIKKFSHIPLRAYHKAGACKKDGLYRKAYKGTLNDDLFAKYALHLKEMYEKVDKRQKDLLGQLKEIFKVISNAKKEESVIINPELNYKRLEEIIKETQVKIIELYTDCETDFLKGFEIYQEIVIRNKDKQSQEVVNELKKQEYYTTPMVDNTNPVTDATNSNNDVLVNVSPFKENTNELDNNTDKADYYQKIYNENQQKIKELQYQKLARESEEEKQKLQYFNKG